MVWSIGNWNFFKKRVKEKEYVFKVWNEEEKG
jgi:hypothetical protein